MSSDTLPTRPSLPVTPGEVLYGRYLIGEVLGEGGMGVVVEATHLGLETKVALKIIRSDLMHDEEFVQRFVNEARAAAQLKGEHIARVYDVGQLPSGEPYLVMERLEGVGLEAFLARTGPLDVPVAVRLVLEVCEGLAEAHALALVHRDIKPANLFLSRRPDGSSIVKILDFGIAKRLADRARRGLTNPARSLGSPWYMSPEQMMDPSRVDARSDVWSLGVLLFELLTNDHPFDGDSVPEVCARVLSAPAPAVSSFRSGVPHALEKVILRCLEKDPERRFANVGELAECLLEVSPVPRSAPRPLAVAFRSGSRPPRPTFGSLAPLAKVPRIRGTRRSGLLGAAAFLFAGVVTGAVFAYGRDPRAASEAWSKLENVRLPGDPVLSAGPPGAPLASDDERFVRLLAPAEAEPPPANERKWEGNLGTLPPAADDPSLTPSEIRRRIRQYERWLKSQGLVRIEDATVDGSNPY